MGDLSRAQWFLWTGANLAGLDGRVAPWSTLAKDAGAHDARAGSVPGVHLGYTTLRERARWLPETVREGDWELAHRRGAGRLLEAAEALGGTLIKAGQFASSRPDLLPTAYTEELSSLQDRVPPRPYGTIEAAVVRELGRPIEKVFRACFAELKVRLVE